MHLPRHLLLPLAAALAGLWTAGGRAAAAPGDLDTSFHGAGWFTTPLANTGTMDAMVLQIDGKIVVSGWARPPSGRTLMAVYRFHPDGSPDLTFNGTGAAFGPNRISGDRGRIVALQTDDKILVAGSPDPSGSTTLTMMRFNPDGSVDTSFGPEGGSLTQFIPSGQYTRALAVQPDGKILVTVEPATILRYHAAGSLDAGFAPNSAIAQMQTGGGYALALLPDGKILTGGTGPGFRLFRLNPDGTPDLSFGGTGQTTLPLAARGDIRSIVPQPDGKILLAGEGGNGFDPKMMIARLLPNGSPDTSFNGTGWNEWSFPIFTGGFVSSILVQNNGRIILTGYAVRMAASDVAIASFLPDGTFDPAFGTGGKVVTDLGNSYETCFSAALLPNGSVLAGGYRSVAGTPGLEFLLARYQTGFWGNLLVEHPAGSPLSHASAPVDFGIVTLGSRTKEFTLRNAGTLPLTGLSTSVTSASQPGEFAFNQPAATSLAPGAQTTFLVTFTPSASFGPHTATLNIASSDAAHSPFLLPLTGARATPAQTWRVTWFGSPDNSGAGADLNDFDNDGLPNLLEYATVNHPHQPSPPPGQLVKNDSTLEFTWKRPSAALTELNYQPEAAATPAGPWAAAGFTITVLSDDGGVQVVRARTPADSGKKFVRLRVTRL